MTFLDQENDICNRNYQQAMELIESGEYRTAKLLIIDVMEKLFNIYQVYAVSNLEKSFYEEKIRKLLKLCKQINNMAIAKINTKEETKQLKELNLVNQKLKSKMKLDEFLGQEKLKGLLSDAIKVAKIKNKSVDHILFFGSAGLGKTTLARIVADEMGANFFEMNAPTIKHVKSIVNIFKNIKNNDIIFIDEIHRLPKVVCEAIYTAMQDNKLSYIENDKNVEINLPNFTLIGATTHSGLLPKAFRDRFYIQLKLESYKDEDLSSIILKCFEDENLLITTEALDSIAKRGRGTPRIVKGYAKRIVDKAIINNVKDIDIAFVETFFIENDIDNLGLNSLDLKYLKALHVDFGGGPVGLETLSSRVNENKNIIEEQTEPYLINLGFLAINSKGRYLTEKGLNYLTSEEKNEM